MDRGILAVLGGMDSDAIIKSARASNALVYFQSNAWDEVLRVRQKADESGLLENKIYVISKETDEESIVICFGSAKPKS